MANTRFNSLKSYLIIMDSPKIKLLKQHSNFVKAKRNADDYYNQRLLISTRKNNKYMILNPFTDKYIHFGNINYEDYLYHRDENRRYNYLKRSAGIRGNWKNNNYSPNNLSRRILWNAPN